MDCEENIRGHDPLPSLDIGERYGHLGFFHFILHYKIKQLFLILQFILLKYNELLKNNYIDGAESGAVFTWTGTCSNPVRFTQKENLKLCKCASLHYSLEVMLEDKQVIQVVSVCSRQTNPCELDRSPSWWALMFRAAKKRSTPRTDADSLCARVIGHHRKGNECAWLGTQT